MNIGAAKSFWIGSGRAVKNWRLWLLFYVLNLFFAAVLALPFVAAFTASVSKSLVGSDMLSGFSYRWYVEFIHANGRYFSSLIPQVVVLFSLYILMEVFMAGGFYPAFAGRGVAKVSGFFSNGASTFFPLLLVTVVEVLMLFVLYKIDVFWAAAEKYASRIAVADSRVFQADLIRYALVAAAFAGVSLLSDFVRAAVTLDDDRFFDKVKRGVSFVFSHPLSSAGLYLVCTIFSAGIIALYFFAGPRVSALNESTVLIGIMSAQIFILLRIFSKLIFYAGEAILYKENQIEVIQVKPEMLE